MYDGYAGVAYVVRMLEDGTGLEISLPDGSGAFRAAGATPRDGVALSVREADGTWRLIGEYRIEDDPEKGVMTAPGETILYDPDTSRRRKEEEKK
jgi:hypothetical protein